MSIPYPPTTFKGIHIMSNQLAQNEIDWFLAENDFEFQRSLERTFAQLERDESNHLLRGCLETLILQAQNQSIQKIAVQIGKDYEATKTYLSKCRQRVMQYPPIQWCWEEYSDPDESRLLKVTSVMSEKEEQDWHNLLAGQIVPNADPKIVRETQIFQAALLSHADKPKNDAEIPYPQIWENVLACLDTNKFSKKQFIQPSWLQKLRNRMVNVIPQYPKPVYALAVTIFIVGILVVPPLVYYPEPTLSEKNSDGIDSIIISKGNPCLGKIITLQPQIVANNLREKLNGWGATEISLTKIKKKQIREGWRLEAILKSGDFDKLLQQYNGLRILPPNPNYLCVNIISNEPTED